MPSLNVKQEKNQSFAGYSLPPANSHEIDLFSLIEVLWQAKRRILATVFAFACVGLLLSFLLPQNGPAGRLSHRRSRYSSRGWRER